MNRKLAAIVIVLFTATASLAQEELVLKTSKQKVSYGIGVDAAKNFLQKKLDIDLEILIKGLRDGFSGNKLLISDEEIRAAFTEFQDELNKKQAEEEKVLSEKNKKEGDAFLAANKTKEGVITLASGLQYKILKAAEGKKPTEESTVEVHYRGTFIDGTEFDSSIKRGQPAKFPLANVIPGWTEGLQLMPVGSEYKFFIPAKLAYGEHGPPQIGPDATLIFDVTLISIDKPEAAKPAAPAAPKKD